MGHGRRKCSQVSIALHGCSCNHTQRGARNAPCSLPPPTGFAHAPCVPWRWKKAIRPCSLLAAACAWPYTSRWGSRGAAATCPCAGRPAPAPAAAAGAGAGVGAVGDAAPPVARWRFAAAAVDAVGSSRGGGSMPLSSSSTSKMVCGTEGGKRCVSRGVSVESARLVAIAQPSPPRKIHGVTRQRCSNPMANLHANCNPGPADAEGAHAPATQAA